MTTKQKWVQKSVSYMLNKVQLLLKELRRMPAFPQCITAFCLCNAAQYSWTIFYVCRCICAYISFCVCVCVCTGASEEDGSAEGQPNSRLTSPAYTTPPHGSDSPLQQMVTVLPCLLDNRHQAQRSVRVPVCLCWLWLFLWCFEALTLS